MKRSLLVAFLLCTTSSASTFAQGNGPANADDEILRADRALVTALEKADRAALDKMLDPELMWIDTDGVMWFHDDALRAGMKSLVPIAADVKVTEHNYGNVVWIQNNQGNKYAAHFWVKRPAGWRLLHIVEIAQRPAEPGDSRPNYFVDCDNPCKEVPFKALSANVKAGVEGWQAMDSGDPALRAKHYGDNVSVVNSTIRGGGGAANAGNNRGGGAGNRAGGAGARGGTAANSAPAAQRLVGAPPALFVRWWDFGDSAVSVMLHADYGARPYWASRVHAVHDGVWKMDESYHTVIWAAPRLTAIPGPQPSN